MKIQAMGMVFPRLEKVLKMKLPEPKASLVRKRELERIEDLAQTLMVMRAAFWDASRTLSAKLDFKLFQQCEINAA